MDDSLYIVIFRTPNHVVALTGYDAYSLKIFRHEWEAEKAIKGHILADYAYIVEV